MRLTAVVGANFGDEGKGLLTDYLCAGRPRSLVVRFNGGAQAGHTVVTPQGQRHVFHHIGAGALAGADTYFSRFFIVNPLLWLDEWRILGGPGRVLMHPDALLSTPYDMLFNRALERRQRHGSCGLGIWETVLRCRGPYGTRVRDVPIRVRVQEYFARRAHEIGLSLANIPAWGSDALWEDYRAAYAVLQRTAVWADSVSAYDNIVFEGAQGLLLDQRCAAYFPHVSGSTTGLANVRTLCRELALPACDLEPIYVTRSYLTRHGRGPFPTEQRGLAYPDATNGPNEWQGRLRFGTLDTRSLVERVRADAGAYAPSLAVTCLDQRPTWIDGAPFRALYRSAGPTRETLVRHGRTASAEAFYTERHCHVS